jgi:putative ABC transport system permease protein
MRTRDLLTIALSALWQQKVRSLLTLGGVVIGSFALAVSLSLGRGFEAEVMRQLGKRDQLRQIMVWPHSEVREADIPEKELYIQGDMSDAKKERLRKSIIRRYNQRSSAPRRTTYLTQEHVDALRQLNHVRDVRPYVAIPFQLEFGKHKPSAQGVSVAYDDDQFEHRLVAGSGFTSNHGDELLVSEYLLYRLGIADDADVRSVIGKKVRLTYHPTARPGLTIFDSLGLSLDTNSLDEARLMEKIVSKLPAFEDRLDLTPAEKETLNRLQLRPGTGSRAQDVLLMGYSRLLVQLPGIAAGSMVGPLHPLPYLFIKPEDRSVTMDFTIRGVLREVTDEDEGLGLTTVMLARNADLFLPQDTAAEMYLPRHRETGYDSVVLHVDDENHVKEVATQIKAMGLREYSLGDWAVRLRTSTVLVVYVTSFLAIVALIVASIGITNTMVMSVMERRREIGIMKAVGARDFHVQLMFLIEGSLLGILGGMLGITFAWLLSYPGDSLARRLLANESDVPLKGPLFIFPLWLILGVPAFATLITTLAALYPARRAARVNPIVALKDE